MQGFPDVELALMEILRPLGLTGTAFDEALTVRIRVNRTGGGTDRLGIEDAAVVTVTSLVLKDSVPASRAASTELNQRIRGVLSQLRAVTTAVGFIDKIVESSSPIALPDFNPDTRKVESTWTVTSRLQELPA
jgi:hypothetical protein